MNEKKSADYKKLVADMQKKYPVYGIKPLENLKLTTSKKGDPDAREVVKKFAATFPTKEDFYAALKGFGLSWEQNKNPQIYEMRAKEALRIAVENGFDPFNVVTKNDPVELFAPVLNGETVCQEINLYTYWQGFGYAKNTPKIKYLLVAQDWGNLFRRDPKDNQGFLTMNKTGEWIAPYNEIPKRNGTDTNLFKLFEILGYDLLKLNDDLFFTNFCLGYRSGKEVGGMTKKMMMNDSAEFKRLCEILEPENILCLGKITSECAYESLTEVGSWKKIYSGFKNYNEFLDNHAELTVNCGNTTAKFYPLAHCGVMGSMMRSLNRQIEDWKRIDDGDGSTEIEMKKTALYGAILGDIIGSPYEFDGDVDGVKKTKDFIFFKGDAGFTDDTVMTIAIAEALLDVGRNADEETVCSAAVIKSMRKFGKKYPYAGYGSGFRRWLETDNPKPYNSFGNGSAMRVIQCSILAKLRE